MLKVKYARLKELSLDIMIDFVKIHQLKTFWLAVSKS